jgi:cytoskeletal protein RodZ
MTPKFIRTSVPEKETLGEKLAKKRAALGYDLKEAERSTRIRAKYIEFLEAGRYEKLPPDVYVQGFLKNYSAFLKLDADKVIRLYKKERGLRENVKKAVLPSPVKKKKAKPKRQKVIITPGRLIIAGAVFGTLLVISYLGWQISILAAPPKLAVNAPADNIKVEAESLIVEGKTDAGADVFINDVPIGVDPDGNFKEKISLQDGLNLIKVSTKNKLNKVTQVTRTVLAKLQTIAPAAQVKQGLNLKIDIGPGSASIYVEVDGKPLADKNILMLAGSSQTILATDKIVISASDGGNVRATLNGKDMGTLGKAGEKVKNKEFTKTSF